MKLLKIEWATAKETSTFVKSEGKGAKLKAKKLKLKILIVETNYFPIVSFLQI